MTIDSEGNVYLSGKGVTVFNPAGKKIEQIPIDAPWTANMCFGGKDHRTLFITAMQNLFSLRMRVKGAGSGQLRERIHDGTIHDLGGVYEAQ